MGRLQPTVTAPTATCPRGAVGLVLRASPRSTPPDGPVRVDRSRPDPADSPEIPLPSSGLRASDLHKALAGPRRGLRSPHPSSGHRSSNAWPGAGSERGSAPRNPPVASYASIHATPPVPVGSDPARARPAGCRRRRVDVTAWTSQWHDPGEPQRSPRGGPIAGPLGCDRRGMVSPGSDDQRGLPRSERPLCRRHSPRSPRVRAGGRLLPPPPEPPASTGSRYVRPPPGAAGGCGVHCHGTHASRWLRIRPNPVPGLAPEPEVSPDSRLQGLSARAVSFTLVRPPAKQVREPRCIGSSRAPWMPVSPGPESRPTTFWPGSGNDEDRCW